MYKLFILAACVATAMAASIPFDKCPNTNGTEGFMPEPVSFAIPECSGFPCGVAVGQNVTLLIGIYVSEAVTSLPVKASVTVSGYTFEFPLPNGDACAAIPSGCPQVPGNYLVTFPTPLTGVDSGTTATVRVQIDNQSGVPVACGSVTTTFN